MVLLSGGTVSGSQAGSTTGRYYSVSYGVDCIFLSLYLAVHFVDLSVGSLSVGKKRRKI